VNDQTRNIYAIGLNYAAHVEEMGSKPAGAPVVFAKSPAALCDGDTVHFPDGLGAIHHELELVLRVGEQVPVGTFSNLDCISDIGLGIDFTARELQSVFKQKGRPWHLSKNFRNAAWVHFPDQAIDPSARLTFSLEVNGETRQSGDSALMLYPFTEILTFLNRTLDLFPGDLIYTGTPKGVGPVSDGDELVLVSDELGMRRAIAVRMG